jgi:hypothetical protein
MHTARVTSLSLEIDATHDGFCNVRQQVQRLGIVNKLIPITIEEDVLREFHSDDFKLEVNGLVVHWKRTNPTGKKFITIVVNL